MTVCCSALNPEAYLSAEALIARFGGRLPANCNTLKRHSLVLCKKFTKRVTTHYGLLLPQNIRVYGVRKSYPTYAYSIGYDRDIVDLSRLSPKDRLRQLIGRASERIMVHKHKGTTPLPLIEDVVNLYRSLLGQGVLEPSDTAAIAKFLVVAEYRLPQPTRLTEDSALKHIGNFAGHYLSGSLPPHPRASMDLLSHHVTTGQRDLSLKFWEVSSPSLFSAMLQLLVLFPVLIIADTPLGRSFDLFLCLMN